MCHYLKKFNEPDTECIYVLGPVEIRGSRKRGIFDFEIWSVCGVKMKQNK